MSTRKQPQRRVAIIGGGISGLAAAYELLTDDRFEFQLFEAADRWGGVLQSERRGGFLIERSADSFLWTDEQPWAGDLACELGLKSALLPTQPAYRKAKVLFRGKPEEIPSGFQLLAPGSARSILRSPLLSWRGKSKVLFERFHSPAPTEQEESLAQFARRRLGNEAYERLVQPLVAGIYSADPERLSVAAALPRFLEWERVHGSLTAGLRAQKKSQDGDASASAARYGKFRSFADGVQTLTDALVAAIPADRLCCGHRVRGVERDADGNWLLLFADDKELPTDAFDDVIIAVPPMVAGELLQQADATLSNRLTGIESSEVAVVSFAIPQAALPKPLDYFGLVVPEVERRDVLAISFSSVKFQGRAPADHELARVFIGGVRQACLLDRPDEAVVEIGQSELQQTLQLRESARALDVARWTTPQYHLGHLERLETIAAELRSNPGLHLAGNYLQGVGIPHCVHSGRAAAHEVMLRKQ